MNNKMLQRLEYDRIKERVMENAVSYLGRQHVEKMEPMTDLNAIRKALDETAEAHTLLMQGASVPLPSLQGIEPVRSLLGTGYMFNESDFTHTLLFLRSCAQLRRYMIAKSEIAPTVSGYAASMHDLDKLRSEIERCIHNGRVADEASKDLSKIRKKLAAVENRIKSKIEALMSRYRTLLQENLVSMRGGRYVLPIKKEFRKQFKGNSLDESASGQTVYMEPAEIAHMQHEQAGLRADEAREEAKVLSELTDLMEQHARELNSNVETVGTYDYLFAKAKYGLAIGGRNVGLNIEGVVDIRGGKHPLLGRDTVPLTFRIGRGYRTLIITGPNTGGKTVALKTVGLLTLMAQSGLLVPVEERSTFAVFKHVAADIGDGQSIEQSLSTFSAHIKNIIDMLSYADDSTLILIDEMASGTDPGEGVALSIAILEELHRRGTTVMVTTHFNEIKNYAALAPGFENARMEFDSATLQPLYQLRIGEAGHSYAFLIAQKLGISPAIIARSEEITAGRKELGAASLPLGNGVAGGEGKSAEAAGAKPDGHSWQASPVQQSQDTIDMGAVPIAERPYAEPMMAELAEYLDGVAIAQPGSSTLMAQASTADAPEEQAGEPSVSVPVNKRFEAGDSVYVSYLKREGIVCEEEDTKGNVGVFIEKQRIKINKKHLQHYLGAGTTAESSR
ncbi:DNA mismatch repair protein MutS [Paenibacillus profundus]|uniref:DNA mismatch repair protein MutS n=1 Tax=Paenibacillus profundus TaxID=1173085 RepID=A0ABS8YC20_9BACL|nr:DNA mismatch repair protein MutS [Paenibacillus profundus]MCE5168749.1 DNA mismatch repair protein MutS [Paenibacillus profundus]